MNELTTPLVSVAICTYNGARYLRQQLESITKQTYRNIELVILDDASRDGTLEIIREFANKDARIRFQENAENLGYNRNFEKAISLCKGEIVAISDQDDVWESTKLETMLMHWPHGSDLVYSLSGRFFEDNLDDRTNAPDVFYKAIGDTHHLVFNSPVHGHAILFRKNFVKHCMPFPPDVYYDWWISMHAASLGVIGCVPHTLTWHRVHQKNNSRHLTSIANRKERERQLREQCAHFIETFMRTPWPRPEEKRSLLKYAGLLREMNGKKFSWKMFGYTWKNRDKVFHYKRKPLVIFSHLKHALRMGRRGLL